MTQTFPPSKKTPTLLTFGALLDKAALADSTHVKVLQKFECFAPHVAVPSRASPAAINCWQAVWAPPRYNEKACQINPMQWHLFLKRAIRVKQNDVVRLV